MIGKASSTEKRPLLSGTGDDGEAKDNTLDLDRAGDDFADLEAGGDESGGEGSETGEPKETPKKEGHLRIFIKMVDGGNHTIDIPQDASVPDLKDAVRAAEKVEGPKNIRLIYMGKILDANETLAHYKIPDESFVHCTISEPRPQVVELEETGPTVRGFERLRFSGFSEQEIETLRMQFHRGRAHNYREGEDLRDIEEEWFTTHGGIPDMHAAGGQGPGGGAAAGGAGHGGMAADGFDADEFSTAEGGNADMLWGIIMGFLLGPIMLFWLCERAVPRRQKLGILAGVGCNVTMSLLRSIVAAG
eukprot:GFYU01007673.1.p1 GENE.GFYU01007673.1~~GFYU01007673.1.p1  ORF type:complete len:303 (+),score=58.80 GFYU01007673.1:202-1110(+)